MSKKEKDCEETISKLLEGLNLSSSSSTPNFWQQSLEALNDKVIVGLANQPNGHSQQKQQHAHQNGSAMTAEDENAETAAIGCDHDEKIFNLACNCSECYKHRETLIQLYLEDVEYNMLWERLQEHLLRFYDIIPQSSDSPVYRKYKELMNKHQTKWLSDGCINLKSNIRLSLGSYLPLSNEMIFNILYNRDPHQLFELICIQMQAVVMAYTEGLKKIVKYENDEIVDYNPNELLNFIFDGYAKICQSERTISALFFELEAGHLLQFHLSFSLVFKRIYQRWIYLELQKLVPECILRLKELDYNDNYTMLVQKFIKFDDVMTSVTQTWRDIWLLIHNFHKSKEDIARRRRISAVHSVFLAIKESEFEFDGTIDSESRSLIDWVTWENRGKVWQYVVYSIKNKWLNCTHPRLGAALVNIDCSKCQAPFVPHFVGCSCRSCILAGGPSFARARESLSSPSLCTKCAFFEKLMNGITVRSCVQANDDCSTLREQQQNVKRISKVYHLSWAVFKHLADRVPYTSFTLDPITFCVFQEIPCTRYACRIAANIITLTYPPNFSKYLIRNYQPLEESARKKIMTIQNLDVDNLLSMIKRSEDAFAVNKKLHALNVTDKLWSNGENMDGDTVRKASALAECFLVDFHIPQKSLIFPYFLKLFRPNGRDIEFNLDQLELMKKPNAANLKSIALAAELTKPVKDEQQQQQQINDVSVKMSELTLKKVGSEEIKTTKVSLSTVERITNTAVKKAMDGEIKKPLVEALQLAASNKKLEAELKSLQKEHSMLKDMVRDLEQIHEEKHNHQCGFHGDEANVDSRDGKSSHRAEGQCICYYCTIFGQSDCSHNNRANETRDRLRKRLHQLQSTKEANTKPFSLKDFKIPPGLVKRVAVTKSAATMAKPPIPQTQAPSAATTATVLPPPSQQQPQNVAKAIPRSPQVIQTPVALPKPQQQPMQCRPRIPPVPQATTAMTTPPIQVTAPKVEIQKVAQKAATPINCASLDEIVKFIEGGSKNSKESAAKREAKKNRQKQRKYEQKKLGELEEMKAQLEEIETSQVEAKKMLKGAKRRKNKAKIFEIEENLRDLLSRRSVIRKTACEIIATVQAYNPEFDFDLGIDMEEEKEESAPPQPQPQPKASATILQQTPHGKCEVSLDASKQMVTIRRINLPHAEPQVTVTAKGDSPDKDQLLYTFINGHLVPASSDNQQLYQQIQMQANCQYPANYFQPNPGRNPPTGGQSMQAKTETTNNGATKKKKSVVEIQKIQQQIQKQQQKDQAKALQMQKKAEKQQRHVQEQQQKATVVETKSETGTKKKKGVVVDSQKNQQPSQKQPQKDWNKTQTPKKAEKQQRRTQEQSQQKAAVVETKVEPVKRPKAEKKRRSVSYIDPEFDNNAFKLLDMDDSEEVDEFSESSDDNKKDENVKPAADDPPASKKQQIDKKSVAPPPTTTTTTTITSTSNTQSNVKSKQAANIESTAKSQTANIKSAGPSKMVDNKAKAKPGGGKKQPTAGGAPTQIEQTVKKVEKMTKVNTKQKMHLNADTTIELVKENGTGKRGQKSAGVSIMEQLNRGVKVEGLQLPPGITLTRVDPNSAEALRAKRDAIGKLSQPMTTAVESQPAPAMMTGPGGANYMVAAPVFNPTSNHGGVIMVETNGNGDGDEKQGKNRSRRNRKKKNKDDVGAGANPSSKQKQQQSKAKNNKPAVNGGGGGEPKMVTLRNPMFNSVSDAIRQQQPPPPAAVRPPVFDQPAAIIKNENGMFTIRNPALHQAISQGQMVNPLPHYNAYCSANAQLNQPPACPESDFSLFGTSSEDCSSRKCNSAIGSEIKTAQQMKQQWKPEGSDMFGAGGYMPMGGGGAPRCYSPFEQFGFNSDFVGGGGGGGGAPTFGNFSNYGNDVGGNVHNGFPNLFNEPDPAQGAAAWSHHQHQAAAGRYDDLSFLQNLQPGQRLNSEVTIHNINESKFLGRQQPPISNGVEITRIPPNEPMATTATDGSESISLSELLSNPFFQKGGAGIGQMPAPVQTTVAAPAANPLDSVYASSATADTEALKRFNYLFYEPPKENKSVSSLKQVQPLPAESPQSSIFGEISSSLSNTPPSDDLYHEVLGQSNSDPIFYDAGECGSTFNGHGVIGGEIKAGGVHGNAVE